MSNSDAHQAYLETSDFLRGQSDCMNGEEHKDGQSESYDRGYSAQYELEQVRNELCR